MGDLEICRLRDERIIQPDKRFASPVKGLLVGFSSPAHALFRHDAIYHETFCTVRKSESDFLNKVKYFLLFSIWVPHRADRFNNPRSQPDGRELHQPKRHEKFLCATHCSWHDVLQQLQRSPRTHKYQQLSYNII